VARKAAPTIRSGGESQNIPKFATRFKFIIATAAAAAINRNTITHKAVADKFLPPSDFS
jgi:hypothetical protein